MWVRVGHAVLCSGRLTGILELETKNNWCMKCSFSEWHLRIIERCPRYWDTYENIGGKKPTFWKNICFLLWVHTLNLPQANFAFWDRNCVLIICVVVVTLKQITFLFYQSFRSSTATINGIHEDAASYFDSSYIWKLKNVIYTYHTLKGQRKKSKVLIKSKKGL